MPSTSTLQNPNSHHLLRHHSPYSPETVKEAGSVLLLCGDHTTHRIPPPTPLNFVKTLFLIPVQNPAFELVLTELFIEQLDSVLTGNEVPISHDELIVRSRDQSVSDYGK
ncbi:hypothetical protein L2E82_10892 [Cichorium intybus]|uniref:Uncharacterized protein n=1 Tax=Cichorium intybus TaxID=13427 RepID=A0ACB9GBK8_CICIN|nr:hypothetical protein L2E82_10892 [Cichorium intybus]